MLTNKELGNLYITQAKFRNWPQIAGMMTACQKGENIFNHPAIISRCDEDGELEISDGHHRLMAKYLSGQSLADSEYTLVSGPPIRSRYGRIKEYRNKNEQDSV